MSMELSGILLSDNMILTGDDIRVSFLKTISTYNFVI